MGLMESVQSRLEGEILEIENRDDLSEAEKVSRTIHVFSVAWSGAAAQPFSLVDTVLLTSFQVTMGSRIAATRGIPMDESRIMDIITDILQVIRPGLVARLLLGGAHNPLGPVAGALMTIPMAYGLIFAMGRVMDACFITSKNDQALDQNQLGDLWRQARAEGTRLGRINKKSIRQAARQNHFNPVSRRAQGIYG
jgi:uncharacterized protein (DUF697 family)